MLRVPRTRNHFTLTEAGFWAFIISALRNKSRYWKPITECKKNAKVKYVGANKNQKWAYLCAICKKQYKTDEVEIDHIKPVGSLRKAEDLPKYVENLFCEIENFQCLCKKCHKEKTDRQREEKKQKIQKQ